MFGVILKTKYGIEKASDVLIKSIQMATATSTTVDKPKFVRKKRTKWTPRLAEAVRKSKTAHYLWKKAGCPKSKANIYCKNRNIARKKVRSVQRQQTA